MARNHVVDGNVMRFLVQGQAEKGEQCVSWHYASWENAYHRFRYLSSFCRWNFVRLIVEHREGCFDVWDSFFSWEYCRAEKVYGYSDGMLYTFDYFMENGRSWSEYRGLFHE